jgi:hypothetical protein
MDADRKREHTSESAPTAGEGASPAVVDSIEARARTGARHSAQPAKSPLAEAGGAAPRTSQAAVDHAGTTPSLSATGTVETARAGAKVVHPVAEAVPEPVRKTGDVTEEHIVRATRADKEAAPHTAARAIAAKSVTLDPAHRSTEASRTVFETWAGSVEASLRAAVNLQTATFVAGISLFEAANTANREIARQWSALARQTRTITMEAWRSSLRPAGASHSEHGEERR